MKILTHYVLFAALIVPPLAGAPLSDSRAEMMFRELEERLLSEKSLQFKFTITSEGPIASSLEGQVRLKSGNRAYIEVSGTYQSERVNTRFESDGKKMHWTVGDQKFALETPKSLNEDIITGFTRMGLLHNLVLLLDGKPPDQSVGSADDWIQVSDFRFAAPDPSSKVRGRSVRFQIAVEGKNAAEADYWISHLTRVPVERRQTVHFPAGDMKVSESYQFPE